MPALESATVSSQPDVCISLQGVPCPSDKPKHTYYQKFEQQPEKIERVENIIPHYVVIVKASGPKSKIYQAK